MSLASRATAYLINGDFGSRALAVAAGAFTVGDVDDFLAQLAKVDRKNGTITQAFDASLVAGAEHLVLATRLALNAQAKKSGFAESASIEMICWTSGERQIGRAFKKLGVKEGTSNLALVTVGEDRSQAVKSIEEIFRALRGEMNTSLLELTEEKKGLIQKTFSISQTETAIAPLQRLVLERIALLSLAK